MRQITHKLIGHSGPSNLTFVGITNSTIFIPYMEHVTCFLPAVLALGHMHGYPSAHLSLARDLMLTCYQLYKRTPTGLAPEGVYFNQRSRDGPDFVIKVQFCMHMTQHTNTMGYTNRMKGWTCRTSFALRQLNHCLCYIK